MQIPETRYTRTGDGLNIAYQIVGDGSRDLVWCAGIFSNIESQWDLPEFADFFTRLGQFCRLILFDRRGAGASDRVPDDAVPSLEVGVEDLSAVMDAVGSRQATLFGFTDGVPLSVLFAAAEPQRVEGLILWDPNDVCGRPTEEFPWAWSDAESDEFIAWIEQAWGSPPFIRAYLGEVIPSLLGDPDALRRYGRQLRLWGSPKSQASLQRVFRDIDVIPALPSVQAPTLVIHRSATDWYTVEASRFVASRIPGARLLVLPDGDAVPHMQSESVIDAIAEFLTGTKPSPDVDRILATVLFTDIVASTRLAAELGDARWKQVLGEHDALARAEIGRHRGRFVESRGDGLVATFDGPARAVRCAQAIAAAVRPLRLEIRAGAHTGEVELLNDGVQGIAVHIGARISALAGASEIWVSSTVKDLVAGSGLTFEDRGEHELKGVPDRWHLFRVGA